MHVYGCLDIGRSRIFYLAFTIRNVLFHNNWSMLPSISKLISRRISGTGIIRTSTAIPAPNVKEAAEGPKDTSKTNETLRKVLEREDYFKVYNLFTVKDLFDAKVHFGHKLKSLDDRMKPFVFGSRLGHVIFDLDITAYHLRKALNFCAHVAYRDGIILFISHNKRCSVLVEKTAEECKEFAFTRDWIDGLFTQSEVAFKCVTRLPDLCILLNTHYETGQPHRAVIEASRLLIPVIAVVDSNCNPNLITYPVPGNDDSPSSVSLFCNLFKKAILRGKETRTKHINAGLLSANDM